MLMSKPASHWLSEWQFETFDHSRSGTKSRAPYLHEDEIEAGRALFEAHMNTVRMAVEQCVETFVEDGGEADTAAGFGPVKTGVSLFVFQEQACGARLVSDVAEVIRKKDEEHHGVLAGFTYLVDKPGDEPKLFYSLRGLAGFDVAAFAKANGGGGHTLAAAFSLAKKDAIDIGDPYDTIRELLEQHLDPNPEP